MKDKSTNPWSLYERLLDHLPYDRQFHGLTLDGLTLGVTWALSRVKRSLGLALSPEVPNRTLAWAGTMQGRA